jgi:hypothetical protein
MSFDPPNPSDTEGPTEDRPFAIRDTSGQLAEPSASAAPPTPATTRVLLSFAAIDPASRLVIGSGTTVAGLALLGGLFGAYSWVFSALILFGAGLLGVWAGWITAGRATNQLPLATRDLGLIAGTVSTVVGILFAVEVLFDLDDLDAYGGVFGAIITLALAGAAIVLYVAASRAWSADPTKPWTVALAGRDRPLLLVLAGTGLVVLGWLANVTIGFWYMEAGTEVVTLALIAALLMRAEADPETPLRVGFPVAYIALGLVVVCLLMALQHTLALGDEGAGIDSWLFHLVYVAGVVGLVAGAGLGSAEAAGIMKPVDSGGSGPAAKAP